MEDTTRTEADSRARSRADGDADPEADPRAARANRLYWESSRSVKRIAQDLRVSKGTLYALVEPLRASLPCPECAGELVYANRTARERGLLACPGCGLVEDETLIREAWTGLGSPSGAVVVSSPPAARSIGVTVPDPAPVGGRVLLGVGLLAVAAVGVGVALWMRRV